MNTYEITFTRPEWNGTYSANLVKAQSERQAIAYYTSKGYTAVLVEETLPGNYTYDRHKVYPEPDKRIVYLRYDLRTLEGEYERIVYRAHISPLELPDDLIAFGKLKIGERNL